MKYSVNFKIWTSIFLVMLGIIIVSFAIQVKNEITKWDGLSQNLQIDHYTTNGYEQSEKLYLNTEGDAHIQLPELNQYLDHVSIYFSSPLKQKLGITVYYAAASHGYDENYTSSITVPSGVSEAHLSIGQEITTCRIDIGSIVGEEFELEKVVLNDEAGHKLNILEIGFQHIIVLILLSAVYILFVIRPNLEKVFLFLLISVGLLYIIVITPFSVADESHHYHSSYQLSNYFMLQWDESEYGNVEDFDYSKFCLHYNISSGYLRIINDITETRVEEGTIQLPQPRKLSYFVEYIPQALGISMARLLNLNFILLFFCGRFFNLLFYACCVYFAIQKTPRFKLLFGLISFMPMAVHQAASYSYDAFINGIAFLLIAFLLKAIYEDGPLSPKDYGCILLLGVLLAPAKIIYSTILLLFWLVPRERFRDKKDKWVKFAIILSACAAVLLLFQLTDILTRVQLEPISKLNWEGQQNYSLGFAIENPLETIKIFLRTLRLEGTEWLFQAVGYRLSGLSLLVPQWIIWCWILIISLSALNDEASAYRMQPRVRNSFLLISVLIVLLAMYSMFTGHTSNTHNVIKGVQGRYFIPIFPLLTMSLNNQTIVLRRHIEYSLTIVAVILQAMTLFTILNYTF